MGPVRSLLPMAVLSSLVVVSGGALPAPAAAAPTIATQASAGLELGEGTLTDTATVAGLVNPVTGGGTYTLGKRSRREADAYAD